MRSFDAATFCPGLTSLPQHEPPDCGSNMAKYGRRRYLHTVVLIQMLVGQSSRSSVTCPPGPENYWPTSPMTITGIGPTWLDSHQYERRSYKLNKLSTTPGRSNSATPVRQIRFLSRNVAGSRSCRHFTYLGLSKGKYWLNPPYLEIMLAPLHL